MEKNERIQKKNDEILYRIALLINIELYEENHISYKRFVRVKDYIEKRIES